MSFIQKYDFLCPRAKSLISKIQYLSQFSIFLCKLLYIWSIALVLQALKAIIICMQYYGLHSVLKMASELKNAIFRELKHFISQKGLIILFSFFASVMYVYLSATYTNFKDVLRILHPLLIYFVNAHLVHNYNLKYCHTFTIKVQVIQSTIFGCCGIYKTENFL